MSPLTQNPKRAAMEQLMREGMPRDEAYMRVFGEKPLSAGYAATNAGESSENQSKREVEKIVGEARSKDLEKEAITEVQRSSNITYPPEARVDAAGLTVGEAGSTEGELSKSSTKASIEALKRFSGIDFASDEAAEYAISVEGLNADHFDALSPSGASGAYTKADVKLAVDEMNAQNDEDDEDEEDES